MWKSHSVPVKTQHWNIHRANATGHPGNLNITGISISCIFIALHTHRFLIGWAEQNLAQMKRKQAEQWEKVVRHQRDARAILISLTAWRQCTRPGPLALAPPRSNRDMLVCLSEQVTFGKIRCLSSQSFDPLYVLSSLRMSGHLTFDLMNTYWGEICVTLSLTTLKPFTHF